MENLFGLGVNGKSFPMAFSFSDLIEEKFSSVDSIPSVLVGLIQASETLKEQVNWANDSLNKQSTSLKSIMKIMSNINAENNKNGIYKDVQIYSFNDSSINKHGGSDLISNNINSIESSILRNIKDEDASLVNAFSKLLVNIDNQYSTFFSQRSISKRTSKLVQYIILLI